MTDIIASYYRTWASSDWDLEYASIRARFGLVTVLAGVATEPRATQMKDRLIGLAHEAQRFGRRPSLPAAAT